MGAGLDTGQKQSWILITEGGLPNVDVSRVFVDKGEHLNTMPWEHVYLHKKRRYITNALKLGLANNGTIDMVLTTGAAWAAHLVWIAAAGGDVLVEIFKDAVINSGGSALTVSNRSQEAPVRATTLTSALLDPTLTSPGTSLVPGGFLIPGGTGGVAQGGGGEGRDELIQPVSSTYLYRLTNMAGLAKNCNLALDFYEHETVEQ